MKFNADQQWRCECRTCDEFVWLDCDPGTWSDVEACDDAIFNFRGTCPRCRILAAGENPDADPAWPDHSVRESGVPRRCGTCRNMGKAGDRGSLPDWHPCGVTLRTSLGLLVVPRVQPDHGTECEYYERRI